MTEPVNRETVRTFITTIVAQAKAALDGMEKPGRLQISRLHPTSEKLVPNRYELDDVERMVDDAVAAGEAHNVYIEGRTIREDTTRGNGRGKIEDTAAVFALVIDSDADTKKAWKPNGVAPSMTVETSPGNFQYWFFFRAAISADVARKLGDRLRTASHTDQDTGVVTQPYRVAGTANYPNKKKIERGRVTVPTRLIEFNAEQLWTPEELERVFPVSEKKDDGRGAGPADESAIPELIMRVIRDGPITGADRSLSFFKVIRALKSLGLTVDTIAALFERHPDGVAKKYEGRLRKEVERAYDKIDVGTEEKPPKSPIEEAPPEDNTPLAELNRDNIIVLDGGKARVLRFETVTHKADDRCSYSYRVPFYLTKDDFQTMYMNRRITVGDSTVELGKWWLKHPARQQYFGVLYEPGREKIMRESGIAKLNLWTGWGVDPKPGDWSLMRRHIREVLAAGDEAFDAYIMNWLAWRVQHPDRRQEAALVFLGKPGSGRGTLGVAMCRIFGNHGLHISSTDHLTGRFNAHQRQCSFLFSDEAYTVEDKGAAAQLKRVITEPTLQIEGKGKDIITVPNRLAVMMASNEDWVIPAGEWERRYAVQRVDNRHAQDPAWFDPLYNQLFGGGLEAMLHDLLRRELGSSWHPRQIIRTAALAEQQEQSLSPLDAWWIEILQTGLLPAGNDAGRIISNDYETIKTSKHGDRTERHKGFYTQAREASPKLKQVTDAAFGRYLRDKEKVGAKRAWVARQRGWQLPPLEKCRAKWSKRFPSTVWETDVDSWRGQTVANWANENAREAEGEDDGEPPF